jgi:hypothetical protein
VFVIEQKKKKSSRAIFFFVAHYSQQKKNAHLQKALPDRLCRAGVQVGIGEDALVLPIGKELHSRG